ncbi:MAG: FAD-binding oxidoreductase, partial [Thermomicrobiaceae bacterium]|nr:FAD-binding oxidoreductase [Thermomicrobiaceae bacterium]
ARAVYPPTRRAPLLRAWTGLEAVAADEVPILGPAPGIEGLTLACGFTGHGFALAPAVGELMAETILGGRVPPLVEPLTLARFHAA